MKISDMSVSERPRERMLSLGAGALSNAELFAILIRTGTKTANAVDLAQSLLSLGGGHLLKLNSMTVSELSQIQGIKKDKALIIMAAFELGRRFIAEASFIPEEPVTSAGSVFRIMRAKLKGLNHEECWVIMLNNAQRVLGCCRMTSGGGSSTTIDIKDIIREALRFGAQGMVLVHNHPSGNPMPGKADVEQTQALKRAASSMDLSLLDHVVICDDCYYSFADETVGRI